MLYLLAGVIIFICCLGTVCRAWDKQPKAWLVEATQKNGNKIFEVWHKTYPSGKNIKWSSSPQRVWADNMLERCLKELEVKEQQKIITRTVVKGE